MDDQGNLINRNHIEWFLLWINNTIFDDDTELWVRSFQEFIGIKVDGIVGIQTYTSLRSFSLFIDGDTAQTSSEPDALKMKLVFESPSISTILPSVPILFLRVFLNALQHIAADFTREKNKQDDSSNLFEEMFRDLNLSTPLSSEETDLIKNELKVLSGIESDNIQTGEGFNRVVDTIVSFDEFGAAESGMVHNKIDRAIFSLFQAEYIILEPIFTILLYILSPFASYQQINEKDLSLIVRSILEEWKNHNHQVSAEFLTSDALDDFSTSKMEGLQFLFTQSIYKFKNLLKNQFGLIVGTWIKLAENQRKELKLNLYLYYILHKIDQRYFDRVDPATSSLIFKKEYLAIEHRENQIVSEETGDNWSSIGNSVTIPVSNSSLASYTELQYSFLPYAVDLSYWCSAIKDQGSLKSCSAFAGTGLLEYFSKRTRGFYKDVSPLFLYKTARNLMQLTEDLGASLRNTMKAMEKFGVPPAEYWPYFTENVNEEPPQFCYSVATHYQALKYFRLDHSGLSGENLLYQIKAILAAGFPCAFGFTIYTSVEEKENVQNGWIPLPNKHERFIGGHAVVAVGYNDFIAVRLATKDNPPGALLIRNSWGKDWGIEGYGWLPYSYIVRGLTADWWSLIEADWVEEDLVGIGSFIQDPGGGWPVRST